MSQYFLVKSENHDVRVKGKMAKATEYKMLIAGAGDMAQPLRALAVLAEDWGQFPASTLNGSQPSSKGSNTLSGLCECCTNEGHKQAHIYT